MKVETFEMTGLTTDAFLGGKVQLQQPRDGYRAGVDPVLLAASIEAIPGQSVLELGCGAAPALCCLGKRVPGLQLYGLEIQPAYARLGQINIESNALTGTVWHGDVSDPPTETKAMSFHHVIANPPYFEAEHRIKATDGGREIALAGETALEKWVETATKRLRPKGYATFIQRSERLPELIDAMRRHLGALELLPLLPRAGRPPRLILLRGRKDGRSAFQFHPPQVMHEGAVHIQHGTRYTPQFDAILSQGAALPFSA